MTTPTITMRPTAIPAMSRPDVPPLESAAGLVDGDGTAEVGGVVGAAVVGEGEADDAAVLVGEGLGLAAV
jgi:hypothetical protein